jgi:hypothetical protein
MSWNNGWPTQRGGIAGGWPVATSSGELDSAVQRRAVRDINATIDEHIGKGGNPDDAVEMIDTAVRDWVNAAAGSGDFSLTPMLHRQLAIAVHNERYGLGRLQPLVDDPEVENIDANGFDQVWVSYSDGRVEQAEPIADNDMHLIEMIRRWSAFLGQSSREFSDANPKVRLTLPQTPDGRRHPGRPPPEREYRPPDASLPGRRHPGEEERHRLRRDGQRQDHHAPRSGGRTSR